MKQSLATLTLLAAIAGCGEPATPGATSEQPGGAPIVKTKGSQRQYDYDSVPPNPEVRVPAGFRGEVHPALHGETALEVTAHWKPQLKEEFRGGIKLGKVDNATVPEYSIPEDIVALLTRSAPALERAIHGAADLSVFLPEEFTGAGQMWAIDPEATTPFLKQFHPSVSTAFEHYSQPYGRRPGPAGAFGILRAMSSGYLDVLFRVHAEFTLADGVAVYTPACFLGRLLIDRASGTVESFQMRVPTDRAVNVNIALTFRHPERPRKEVTNIVFEHVEPMELVGGNARLPEDVAWEEEIELAEAERELKSAFYKFMDIAWVPPEEMLDVAEEAEKPIMLVVLTSPLDDQSC